MAGSKGRYKIWKATKDSEAGFMAAPDASYMIGSKQAFIAVGKTGTTISGPTSFLTTSENLRYAGMFASPPDFINLLPSTLVSPIPQRLPIPPMAFATSMIQSLPFILAGLA